MKNLTYLIFLCFISLIFPQKSFSQTPNNLNGWFPDGEVRTMSSDENYIYLGGDFQSFTKKGVKGSNAKLGFFGGDNHNALNENFSQFITGDIYVAISDNRGGWYIGGDFELTNNPKFVALIHINADKTIDYNWNTGLKGDDYVGSLLLVGDVLYVAGDFEKIGGQNRANFAKISTNTGLAFDDWLIRSPYSNEYEYTSGKFFILRDYVYIYGSDNIRRFSIINGNIDSSWFVSCGNYGDINKIISVGTDLYVGGYFNTINGKPRKNIVKLSTTSFGNEIVRDDWNVKINNEVRDLCVSDGYLYVGGYFSEIDNQQKTLIARIAISTGIVDNNWTTNLNVVTDSYGTKSFVEKIIVLNQNIYISGKFNDVTSQVRNFVKIPAIGLGNIDFNWTPNPAFYILNNSNFGQVLSVSNNEIFLAGGGLFSINGVLRNNIARIKKSNMELDLEWNPVKNKDVVFNKPYIYTILVKNNFLYVGGSFNEINQQPRNCIARFTTSGEGSLDAWNPNSTDCYKIFSMVASQTDIFVAGGFKDIGGQERSGIAKIPIMGDGSVDSQWNAKLRTYGTEHWNRLYLSGDYLYIFGDFWGVDTQNWHTIIRVSVSGSGQFDNSWKPSCSYVWSCIVDENYTYIGGKTLNPKTNKNQSLARFSNTTGQLDKDWIPSVYGSISDIKLVSNDLYLGGYFSINDANVERDTSLYRGFAKMSILDNKFDDNWTMKTPYIYKSRRNRGRPASVEQTIIDGNKIYIIGDFSLINSYKVPYFASLNLQDTPSTKEYFESVIKVYPNPANDIINVDIADAQYNNFKVNVVDVNGKIIENIESKVQPEGFKIDISKLNSGMYFLQLESKNAKIMKRIIKTSY